MGKIEIIVSVKEKSKRKKVMKASSVDIVKYRVTLTALIIAKVSCTGSSGGMTERKKKAV
jgi:hypothetical protein